MPGLRVVEAGEVDAAADPLLARLEAAVDALVALAPARPKPRRSLVIIEGDSDDAR